SPWRLDYILSEKTRDCILCDQEPALDKERLVVYRSRHCYVMINRYPYNNGHVMCVPYVHVSSLSDLSDAILSDLIKTLRDCETVMNKVYLCDGINMGLNLGSAAGAGITDHLHFHVIPRWVGDSSFMTIVSGERIIPEAFERTYARLGEAFSEL
ncbi:MAG: HIT domain-containing protein, partial [Candidatus Cloacimonetes bacterium]|nr:HIT domain-containing protein [Candidatus Cloacimonadota bacterium]